MTQGIGTFPLTLRTTEFSFTQLSKGFVKAVLGIFVAALPPDFVIDWQSSQVMS
jgi:hypothetical protein